MRQEHRYGEKVFIDYSDGLSIIDPLSGELTLTQLFLAVWGASNYTYADMAEHYGCAVVPARPRKPRDKAKAEAGVLLAQRWILAVRRKRTFYSLAELNAAIRECLERLNTRPLRRLGKSRRDLFETIGRSSALPLPVRPYEYAEWFKVKVGFNYHIDVNEHSYRAPFQLLHEKLDVRLTATTLEAFRKGERVAAHARSYVKGGYTTLREYMPPEQAYKACMGIINLGRHYEPERVEAAAERALKYNACSYRSLKAILTSGLDKQPDRQAAGQMSLPLHENIRGKQYYQ